MEEDGRKVQGQTMGLQYEGKDHEEVKRFASKSNPKGGGDWARKQDYFNDLREEGQT